MGVGSAIQKAPFEETVNRQFHLVLKDQDSAFRSTTRGETVSARFPFANGSKSGSAQSYVTAEFRQTGGSSTIAKSAFKTQSGKKRLHDETKKRPQDTLKKRHDIINPVGLVGVVGEAELIARLKARGHIAWCSHVRTCGLLLIIDYVIRKRKKGQVPISADLARSYISKLGKTINANIKEPLPLLCDIGIFQRVRQGVHAHVHASAVYRFGENFQKVFEARVTLPPKLANKFQNAEQRCLKRLNRKYPYRRQLLNDLCSLGFAVAARPLIAKMLTDNGRDNVSRLVSAVDGRNHTVWTSERGQITTSISSCPKELQPHLLLNEEPIIVCDTSNAHWNFLPLILANRLHYASDQPGRQNYIRDGWREHDQLTLVLSSDDFYRNWCVDPQDKTERDKKKQLLNMLLNQSNEKCRRNRLYRWVAEKFSITFAVIEDIKHEDHRNLSKQLHRVMADAIEAALLELQQKGIAAIPLVDALICQGKNHAVVCEALGRHIFLAAGVCPKVGGIRYSPLTEEEEAALAFDDEAVSNDGMSYDEWEAVRTVRCVAALKLLRRCPPLFSPVALASPI